MRYFIPIVWATLLVLAWQTHGWPGVALVGGGALMWGLLHVTRMVTVLQRTAHQPVGSVGSAVMLNAQLRVDLSLLHVLALTRALGEQLSGDNAEPQVYRWTDAGGASVRAEFVDGKLSTWALSRPKETGTSSDAHPQPNGQMVHAEP